ncbi:MAG TPA: TetR/AcrR family transcriptional regulator [Myxococcota bacterium]|nr:TetR/AcrR family transcriptional regulator [Myxococcota bacterium]
MTTSLPRGVRAPRQSRGHDTLERLLDAGATAIAARGFDALTVGDVVRRARSSVGVFYARFADKAALLRCIHQRFCEETLRRFDAAFAPSRWEGASAEAIVRAAVGGLLSVERERRGLVRAFVVAAGHDPGYARRAAQVIEQVARRLRDLLLARREEIAHPDPARAIDFVVWLTIAHLDQGAVYGSISTGISRLPHTARVAALSEVALAYLGIRSAPLARRPRKTSRRSR